MNIIVIALIFTFNIGPNQHQVYAETFYSMEDCIIYAMSKRLNPNYYSCELIANFKAY